jgi:hypothetical protein
MKLRIRGDSVRLRLTQSEVAQVAAGNLITETTRFLNGAKFYYIFEPRADVQKLTALMIENRMIVQVPLTAAKTWALSNTVAMKFEQAIPDDTNEKLYILIEKDFQCLKVRENEVEDETDMFANPNVDKGSCG